ncbi:MAG: choice-of-anchor tandem repeat GloVer-containing protein [Terriglobales bacterium]
MSATKCTQAFLLLLMGLALTFAARAAQAQTETVLYSFTGGSDGGFPGSRLTSDGKGNFYGTTEKGALGYGTVFELSPNGGGGWNETTLYSFTDGADGGEPLRSYVMFDKVGNLYGETYYGGNEAGGCGLSGCGVVFKLSPVGENWTETVLYSFVGGVDDGSHPGGGLIMDGSGNLYGTTFSGGSTGGGIVFELSPSGGNWTERVIYTSGTDVYGIGMAGGLTMDGAVTILGANYDSVFELSPSGNGGWNQTVLHTFTAPVSEDCAALCAVGTPLLDMAGNIYGTTLVGGPWGIVYKLTPGKKGKWTEKVLHAFGGPHHDGASPPGALVVDAAGNIYGMSGLGDIDNFEGTIFELSPPVGTGKYVDTILWNFSASGNGGSDPSGGLIRDSAGNLYGTTIKGGTGGHGVAFELTP